METKKVYRQLPDASKYEIAHDGEIRFVSNKRKIVVDKNGNTAIFNDSGDKITVNKAALLKEVWAKKSPEDVKQKTGDVKEPKATPSAKKEKSEAAAAEVKETKTAKAKTVTPAPKKPTAEVTPASNGTIEKIKKLTCKKYQRIYLLFVNGVDKKAIETLTGSNAGEVSRAIRLDGEKAEKAKALIA